jgi:two-component system response regulator
MSEQLQHIPCILLVEDDEEDIFLTQYTFDENGYGKNLHVAHDGVEAMDFLYMRPPFEHACRPDLILLDLNMPRKDGRAVLEEIKSDPNLATIPVAVLTTSEAEEDILRAYNLHANCYIRKPIEMARFFEVLRQLRLFWFDMAILPPKE